MTLERANTWRPSGTRMMPRLTRRGRRNGADVLAVEQNRAARRLLEAGDQTHRRRLARRIGADQRNHLASVEDDVGAADDLILPVVRGEVSKLQHAGAPGTR